MQLGPPDASPSTPPKPGSGLQVHPWNKPAKRFAFLGCVVQGGGVVGEPRAEGMESGRCDEVQAQEGLLQSIPVCRRERLLPRRPPGCSLWRGHGWGPEGTFEAGGRGGGGWIQRKVLQGLSTICTKGYGEAWVCWILSREVGAAAWAQTGRVRDVKGRRHWGNSGGTCWQPGKDGAAVGP